jgi:mono/diheme cytochrome c family protein
VDRRHEAGQAVLSCIAITIVALAVAQLVPIKRDNPPMQTAVQWDSPQTQNLARRACLDCHSNETTWPWYAYVAPGSWLLRSHVSSAREEMNLSALNTVPAFRASRLPEDVAQQIRTGAMPPKDYLLLHPEARLSDAEKQQLIRGLQQSLVNSLPK